MNLWEIYRGFYQRSHRNSWDEEALENTELVHTWLKELFVRKRRGGIEEHLTAGLALADVLFARESLSGARVYYSTRLKKALLTQKWSLELPPQVLHRWFSALYQFPGHVYILTSTNRENQFKVGATTIPLRKRIAVYEERYRVSVDLFVAISCVDPFEIEKKFFDSSLFTRVMGNASFDSVEWFFGDPEEAAGVLKGMLAARVPANGNTEDAN
jgi:hypothetical protein